MRRSLRTSLSWLAAAASVLGAITLAALIGITTVLNLVARDLATAIESVRVADEIKLQLLVIHDSTSPVTQGAARAELLRAVEESSHYVQTAEEQQRVDELRKAVDAYLAPGAGDAQMSSALTAAQRLSLINIEQARTAQQQADLWDQTANVGGAAAAVLHVVGLVLFFIWLRRGPLRDIEALSDAMDRFHTGDLDARAPEHGPTELVSMARSFNTAAGALVRAKRRQSEYVATAINDLRTPLTAIQLAVSYLSPAKPLPREERIRDLVDLIGRQLTRINGLTGDILNATWIEEGELTLVCENFDLGQIVSESVGMFRSLAPEHRIEVEAPRGPLMFYGDRDRLAQVVNNLLSNALKYSPPGSRVQVGLSSDGERFDLAVSDEGHGIAPEDRERIFETFQRHSATHEEAPGTSLGLWVARRVVEAHGGQMDLDSRLGEGTTFHVFLPIQVASSLRADPDTEPSPRVGTA